MAIIEIPLGIVDGFVTTEIRDSETNEIIGYNQTLPEQEQ